MSRRVYEVASGCAFSRERPDNNRALVCVNAVRRRLSRGERSLEAVDRAELSPTLRRLDGACAIQTAGPWRRASRLPDLHVGKFGSQAQERSSEPKVGFHFSVAALRAATHQPL